MKLVNTVGRDQERGLLLEIGGLADRLRQLRRAGAVANAAQIKVLTGDLRVKWEELRRLRAPSAVEASLQRRGHYD